MNILDNNKIRNTLAAIRVVVERLRWRIFPFLKLKWTNFPLALHRKEVALCCY